MKWEEANNMLVKTFEFESFSSTMSFVNSVAALAEELDHHPDMFISYNKVVVTLMTHKTHSVTVKDRALAKAIDNIY
jgi:4a-hydroxytetrahydrobiopterin dehydratase